MEKIWCRQYIENDLSLRSMNMSCLWSIQIHANLPLRILSGWFHAIPRSKWKPQLRGFHSDLNETFFIGECDEDSQRLVRTWTRKFRKIANSDVPRFMLCMCSLILEIDSLWLSNNLFCMNARRWSLCLVYRSQGDLQESIRLMSIWFHSGRLTVPSLRPRSWSARTKDVLLHVVVEIVGVVEILRSRYLLPWLRPWLRCRLLNQAVSRSLTTFLKCILMWLQSLSALHFKKAYTWLAFCACKGTAINAEATLSSLFVLCCFGLLRSCHSGDSRRPRIIVL